MHNRDNELPSLEAFEQKLTQAKAEKEGDAASAASGMGMRLGAEFAAGVLVGVGFGLMLDHWLDTRPWMMILCLCFGTAAGVRTMMQTIRQYERQQKE